MQTGVHLALPSEFVWTRYGSEGGERFAEILARKEQERRLSRGVFLWGIGNSVVPAVRELLFHLGGGEPHVVFSPMLAKPRLADVAPERVVRWTQAHGIDGRLWSMPAAARVTSRASTARSPKTRHYALVCRSEASLCEDLQGDRFDICDVRNFCSGNPVGASQVTSVVRYLGAVGRGQYVASYSARLAYPYILELSVPVDSRMEAPSDAELADRQLELAIGA